MCYTYCIIIGDNMVGSYIFQICGLFYTLLIFIIYFSKQRVNNIETKIYKYLLISDIIILIIDIISVSFIYSMDYFPLLNLIFGKFYLIMLILWETILLIYVFIISCNDPRKLPKVEKNTFIAATIVFSLCAICIILLPLEFVKTNNAVYSNGLAANFTYATCALFILAYSIQIIKNFKFIKTQKYTPIILFIILIIIGALVQFNFPQLLVVSFITAFVTCLMYFTIENPDVKMIKALNMAKEVADKANNAKTEFLSSMSHEIRTPLNAIVGFSESLKDEKLSVKAKDEVDDIISASETLLEIVNGILDISKIEANKLEIVNSEYDIQKLFKELTSLTKVRIGKKPIDLKVDIDATLPQFLYGDASRLKQIILNLLTNAAKYTDKGQIEFSVHSVISGDVCRLIISVKDTGRGIKKENIDKLFTKFERLDERNSTIEGTGLGLAITKKLVELMHGSIIVDSVYGEGSKFTVSIDQSVVKNPTIKIEKEEPTSTPSLNNYKGKKVLIVDDNELNLKVAARLLEPYEMNIDQSSSGDDAINKIIDGKVYDLILLDDMMPHKSGGETLAELKQIDGFAMPVVVLTANAIEGMKEKYLDMGFDDYLAKPISKEELKRVLQKYLDK